MVGQLSVFAKAMHNFSKSVDQLFDGWLNPQVIQAIFFTAETAETEIICMHSDQWVGGHFSYIIHTNGVTHSHFGKFIEIKRPNRLVFTWQVSSADLSNSVIFIDISATSGGAKIILRQEMPLQWAEFVNEAEIAWTKLLKTFDEVLTEKHLC